MQRTIRIGTRSSALAMWQALFVEEKLKAQGHNTQIIKIDSDGEMNLTAPLYEMGVQGIFTKTLDVALLGNKIDVAVHSLKDVPTQLAKNIVIAAIPERGNPKDVLVMRDDIHPPKHETNFVVATSSLRRKAQWLHRYPAHSTENMRGNINTRLQKLMDTPTWGGALFAAAGLERINLQVPHKIELDWMLPAPAQGALGVACRADDAEMRAICATLNHTETEICVDAERQFLRALMGGCTMPIAAYASFVGDEIIFTGNVLSIDGRKKAEIALNSSREAAKNIGKLAAEEILKQGAAEILAEIKKL